MAAASHSAAAAAAAGAAIRGGGVEGTSSSGRRQAAASSRTVISRGDAPSPSTSTFTSSLCFRDGFSRGRAIASGYGQTTRGGLACTLICSTRERAIGGRLNVHGIHIPRMRRMSRSRSPGVLIRAMDSSLGGEGQEQYGPPPVFPRAGVRDPYKLLGVSRDASDEEIQEARNYLSSQYGGHEKSREAIEAAYDKIIMGSFRERKNTKINLKSTLKKKVSEAPAPIRALTNMVEVPSSQIILRRAALFVLLGVWSVMNPADGGPAFQVAVSLAACIFFLNDRLKSLGRAFLLGFGALVVGWVSGSFLVPVLSSYILPPSWNLELSTALFSYVFLWAACTFLK